MACDGLRVVIVASEWPQARPASGHARRGHGLRPARRPGAGASGGNGDNYYLKSRNISVMANNARSIETAVPRGIPRKLQVLMYCST
jgi:hypothetical protein